MQEARTLTLCLALWLLAAGSTYGATLDLHEGFGNIVPGRDVQMLRDPRGDLTLDSFIDPGRAPAGDPGRHWQPAPEQLALGFTPDTLWLRFTLHNDPQDGPGRVLLELAYPLLDEVDVYALHGNTLARTWLLGEARPYGNRPVFHRNLVVPLEFATPQDDTTVYLRVRTGGSLQVPLRIWEPGAFSVRESRAVGARGIACGMLFVLAITFLVAAFSIGARGFGLYVLHMLCLLAYQGLCDGTAAQYLGIDSDWWDEHGLVIAAWLIMASGLAYAVAFLDAEHRLPRLHRWLDVSIVALLLGLAASLLLPAHVVFPALLRLALVYGVATSAIGLYALWRQVPLAGIYLGGQVLLLVGIELSILGQFGLVGYWIAIGDTMLAGILLQAVLMSWALAIYLRQAREQRQAAQQQEIAHKQDALEAQHRLTKQLETRVDERSNALWAAMRQLESVNRQLAEISRRDGLTGVHNRRYFDERYPELVRLASRREQPLAVLLIDADNFKQVNDTHGHAIGDECLRLVARTLRDVVARDTDLVARYGGEEFVVVLPETRADGALAIAEALRAAVAAASLPTPGGELRFSISIGLAMRVPAPDEDGASLLADADAALYRAKDNGRNRVEARIA